MERSRMALRAIITALAILAASTALLQAEPVPLIKNGDFSADIYFTDDDDAAPSVNWVANTLKPVTGDDYPPILQTPETDPPGGDRYVHFTRYEFHPDDAILKLEQQVDLVPGTYRLDFRFSAFADIGESDYFKVFATSGDDILAWKLLADNEGHEMDVADEYGYLDFTADLNPVLLSFQFVRVGGSPMDASAILSHVDLHVVPVPGAMLLGSIGLGYAGLRLRRRS